MHQLDFGPDGILLVGDGAGDQLVAIETGDTDPGDAATNAFDRIDQLGSRLSEVFGGGTVTVQDMAVNPISKRLYVAARSDSAGASALLTMDGDGRFYAFDSSDVSYVSVPYPEIDSPGSIVSDLRWSDGYVVASVMKSALSPRVR